MVVVNRVLEVPSKAGTTYGSTQTRPPMNPLDYGRSQHVAAWLSPTGEARSLPTNVRAVPSTINNNSLRGARCCSYVDPMPEGGNSFGIGVNVDNFVEERWDRSHRSGSTPSIVRCKAMYQSEYMDRSNEALAGYRQELVKEGLCGKMPVPGQDYRNSKRVGYKTNVLEYATDGFKRGVTSKHADATVPSKQGAAWVGNAPCKLYETLTQTQQVRGEVEFQKIHPSADGHTKVKLTCTKDGKPPPSSDLTKTMAMIPLSEAHGSHWQSMYMTEMCKLPRN